MRTQQSSVKNVGLGTRIPKTRVRLPGRLKQAAHAAAHRPCRSRGDVHPRQRAPRRTRCSRWNRRPQPCRQVGSCWRTISTRTWVPRPSSSGIPNTRPSSVHRVTETACSASRSTLPAPEAALASSGCPTAIAPRFTYSRVRSMPRSLPRLIGFPRGAYGARRRNCPWLSQPGTSGRCGTRRVRTRCAPGHFGMQGTPMHIRQNGNHARNRALAQSAAACHVREGLRPITASSGIP